MKQKLLLKTMLLLFALIAGSSSVWADNITFDFEDESAHRTSGSNSYADNSYTENGATITLNYADAITSGSPLSGTANIMGRIAKNTTNSPVVHIGAIGITDRKVTAISYLTKGVGAMTMLVEYSTDNTNWTTLQSLASMPTSATTKSVSELNITGTNLYLRFTVSVSSTTNSNRDFQLDDIVITHVSASDTRAATTVTISGNETARYRDQSATTPSATVKAGETTIDGASVTWSSTETGVATINPSTGAITLVAPGITTIKANYAGDELNYLPSEGSYELKVYGVFDGISALQTANASAPYNNGTGSLAKISFTNAKVTYVSDDNNAYISDEAGYGAQIYKSSGHGFTAGNIINGTVSGVTLCLYTSGATVVKNVSSGSAGLTITDGTVTPLTKTINAVSAANQSMMVKFKNVTYASATPSFTDGVNTIAYKDQFSVNPTLANGGTYDVTGLLIMDGGVLKVAPISADGIESKTTNPTSQWKNGEAALSSITINKAEGTKKYTFETNSDGTVTYESSNEDIATIASDGTISPVGYGTTTITANVAGTGNYNPDSKSFTLKVVDAGVDVIQISNITFESGTGYKNWTSVSGLTTTANYAGQSNKGVEYIQIRKQSPSGVVTTASAGRAKKVSVIWAGTNTNNRKLTIYGKNTAYTSGSDLYGDGKGTELGTITFTTGDTSGELEIDASKNYGYIGISADGAMYIGTLIIEWDEDVVPMSVSDAGWASFSCTKALDFTGTGVTAYIAIEKDASTVTLTPIVKVPANTGIVVNTAAGTYTIPVLTDAADATTGNLLQPWLTAGTPSAGTYYTLAVDGEGKPIFKKSSGGTLAAGKAYLVMPTSAPVLNVNFGDETTGISTLNVERGTLNDNSYYNLAGQRVAQPTKGLYIVNGKKVLVK